MQLGVQNIAVVDADAHLTEPPDLWTSKLSSHWGDDVPHVEVDPSTGIERWRIGGTWCAGVGTQSQSGWEALPPSFPPTWGDIDPACYDLAQRLRWMDQHGVDAQILYPNVVTFEGHAIKALKDRDLQVAIFQTYNDYVHQFTQDARDRLIPIATVPFWDVDATVAEMTRCAELGFSGIVWAATMDRHGLPPLTHRHWDPVYQRAQDLGISINFHVGVGSTADDLANYRELKDGKFDYGYWAGESTLAFLANSGTMARLITSGVCERFPGINFVSVESGFGFVPFLLEALDWQWRNIGAPAEHAGWLLPSDYFMRQIHCTFWFEQSALSLLSAYQDNVMFETDFPHSTALAPGAASVAPSPRDVVARDAHLVEHDVLEKALSTNARRLYKIGSTG